MKYRLFFFALLLAVPAGVCAGDDVNVLSYYAVGNSLDGQPLVDRVNVLRFFPVFAMRDSAYEVEVTVYYGSQVYSRSAQRMDGGRYWEALLPAFKLGEAIQRLEVESKFSLHRAVADQMDAILSFHKKQREVTEARVKSTFARFMWDSKQYLDSLGMNANKLSSLYKNPRTYEAYRDSVLEIRFPEQVKRDSLAVTVDSLVALRVLRLNDYQVDHKEMALEQSALDTVRQALAREMEVGLADTLYTGPSVRLSDIRIGKDLKTASILYRNYKGALRHMPALDPAESMGVFRVRYVPFPVVGKTLWRPFRSGSPTVFEVGLSFGNVIVAGDEFVKPQLSLRRLGVAFVISDRVFKADPEIMALALTYDFNSYGSLGVGVDFADAGDPRSYFSFGINKKAFESVITGLAALFN